MELQKPTDSLPGAALQEKGAPESNPTKFDVQPAPAEPGPPVSVDAQPTFEHGATFDGRFKLQRALGSGHEGGVWLAEDLRLSQLVILKLLPKAVCRHPGALAALKEVTRHSSELIHPHIARTYGFVEAGEIDAVALEYVEGKTLTQLRLEQPQQAFEIRELTPWLQSLFGALDYAHRRTKLVHGGLRPDNLLVTAGGELMITGFGLAGQIKRWLAFLGPRSEHDRVVDASKSPLEPAAQLAAGDDTYGVGVTLYELVSGAVPFEDGNHSDPVNGGSVLPMATRRAQLGINGETIPDGWEQTVVACLASDPMQRPQNVRELAGRLGIFPSWSDD